MTKQELTPKQTIQITLNTIISIATAWLTTLLIPQLGATTIVFITLPLFLILSKYSISEQRKEPTK